MKFLPLQVVVCPLQVPFSIQYLTEEPLRRKPTLQEKLHRTPYTSVALPEHPVLLPFVGVERD